MVNNVLALKAGSDARWLGVVLVRKKVNNSFEC